MYFHQDDPLTLKMALREWLTDMMHQARDRSTISTRRLGRMQYSRGGIEMCEFNNLMAADTVASAMCHLTVAQVGSVMVEHKRTVRDNDALPDNEEGRDRYDTGAALEQKGKGKGTGKRELCHNIHTTAP